LDAVHFPRPVTRYWAEMHPEPFVRGFREFTRYYGMLIDTLEYRYVNGFVYSRMVPVAESEVPRALPAGEEVFRDRLWREQLREWDETFKPSSIRTHRELQSVDPDALSDDELVAYLTRCRDHRGPGPPGRQVRGVYGLARDIEWAFAGGQLYLLQCRAITRAGPEVRPMSGAPIDVLGRTRLFGDLDKREVETIAVLFKERRFPQGETVIKEGSGGAAFYVIESGEAAVTIGGEQRGTLKAGDYFGEIALIDEGARMATITASSELVLLRAHALGVPPARPGERRDRLEANADARQGAARRRGGARESLPTSASGVMWTGSRREANRATGAGSRAAVWGRRAATASGGTFRWRCRAANVA
jgi:hypothetical protein